MKIIFLSVFIVFNGWIAIGQANEEGTQSEKTESGKKSVQQEYNSTQEEKTATTNKVKGKGKEKKTDAPETALDFLFVGNQKKDMDDLKAAMKDYNKAIELDPNLYTAYLARGAVHFILQDFESSLSDFNKTVELTQALIETFVKRGNVKTILEDWKGAAKEFNKANNLKPLIGEALYNRGNVKHFLEDKEGCCEDLEEAGKYGFLQAYSYIKKYCL